MPEMRPIRFDFQAEGAGGSDLRVTGFHGTEAMSELFSFEIDLASEDADLDFDAIIGRPGTLSWIDSEGDRHAHGIVARFEVTGRGPRFVRYRALLVPLAWLLRYRRQSRIFQEKTVGQILQEVFEGAGLSSEDFRIDLSGSFPTREFCVQYGESDWNFACRLMEEEGIFHFFEHGEDGTVLVVANTPTVHGTISGESTLPFRDPGMGVAEMEHVWRLRVAQQVRHGKVAVRDFDFKRPSRILEGAKAGSSETSLEFYEYPGDAVDDEQTLRMAELRLQELRAQKRVAAGEGNVARMMPGFKFTLEEHPFTAANDEYVLTAVQHWGSQEQAAEEEAARESSTVYHNTFEAIPVTAPFRAPRRTWQPRIDGPQTAIVVGPGGEEIHTDEHGRVKVQFHWDRQGAKNEKSSCWIRVSQSWAGPGWGALQIPRIGQEVIVDFLDGDPDRPIVTGRVYNGENPPPYSLPGEKTKSTIKSDSSLGGGGYNEMRFEDAKGSEEIFLHGQKDYNILIENDRNEKIGHDRTLRVEHDKSESVGNNKSIEVEANHDEAIQGNKTLDIGGNHGEAVHGSMTISVDGSLSETVAVNYSESVGVAMELVVGGALNQSVGAAMAVVVGGVHSTNVGGSQSASIGGSVAETYGKDHTTKVEKNRNLEIGEKANTKVGDAASTEVKNAWSLKAKKISVTAEDELAIKVGSAELVLKKNGDITIKGKKINIKGSGDVILKGSKVAAN